jgi:hypothetical protein
MESVKASVIQYLSGVSQTFSSTTELIWSVRSWRSLLPATSGGLTAINCGSW